MARFRDYQVNTDVSNSDNVDNWEVNYTGRSINKIANKTIIRTVSNFFKYGSLSKKVHI